MELDDRALPLTRGQLDIWLAQQTGRLATEGQLDLFVRIEGRVERDALEWAIRRAVREAEPARAAFFEEDGQVFQRAIDYPDVELAFYDLSGSQHPAQEAYEIASSIRCTPMPFTGPLFKFALFRTRPDEFYWFTCCHHAVIDGSGVALVRHRAVAIYSAIVSGAPIPPAFFGSLQDLVNSELEYEASTDYLEDQAYWTRHLPSESGSHYRLSQAAGEGDPYWPSAPVQLDPVVLSRVQELSQVWNVPRSSVISISVSMSTPEYGKRCNISGFRRTFLSAMVAFAAQGRRQVGTQRRQLDTRRSRTGSWVSNTQNSDPCRRWSKTRRLDSAAPTSKSNSNTLTEPQDEKAVSGRG
jgi:Condensation domain